jgi:AcrR family transcriptional regulator
MSYLAERREEEKERRRLEIIEAAERLYARQGWDGLTMDQLAREARLSRALRQRFHEAAARAATGLDQVQAIGRAYIAYAHEFPYYFDACSRFQAARHPADGSPELDACAQAGDGTIAEVVAALEAGRRDGSIRADLGPTASTATALWGFTHGTLQLMATKSAELARQGVALDQFADHSLALLRHALRATPSPTPGP